MAQKNLKEWTAKQLAYIDRLSDPRETRTKEQLAKDLGVGRTTLWDWQNIEGFNDAVFERTMFYLNIDLPGVVTDMRRASRKGSVDAMKLILQQTGKLRKEPEQEVKVTLGWEEEEDGSDLP